MDQNRLYTPDTPGYCFSHYAHRSIDWPQIPFHVSDIIAQIILKDAPDSEFVVIEDSVWMNHVDPVSGDGTVSEISKLVVRALVGHDIVPNKLTKLISKTQARRSLDLFKDIYSRWRAEWMVRKVVYERPPRQVRSVHSVT